MSIMDICTNIGIRKVDNDFFNYLCSIKVEGILLTLKTLALIKRVG